MTSKKIEDLLKEKKIEQIVNEKVVQGPPTISIQEAVELMQSKKCGYVVLTDQKKVVGIITETDIAEKVLGEHLDVKTSVSKFMTHDPLVLTPQDPVGAAIDLMAKNTIYHLPLVDKDKKLAGMLSVRTLIRFLAEYYPTEVYNLPPDPGQVSTTPEGG